MNAPVTAAVPTVRPAGPRASDTGRAHSAAPFASALDGALNEGRAHGADRRCTPEDRGTRADERSAARDQRIDDRARAADRRADEEAARTAARTDRAADRAEKGTHGTSDAHPGRPEDGATAPDESTSETHGAEDAAGRSAEAPRGGLPALWALVIGGALATPPPVDASPDAAPAPLLPVPAGDPATVDLTAVDLTAGTVPTVGIAHADTSVVAPAPTATGAVAGAPSPVTTPGAITGAPAPATGTVATPAAAAPATRTAAGLPSAFSAVLAESGAVVTGTRTAAPTTPAPAPVALPVDRVPEGAAGSSQAPATAPAAPAAPAPVVTGGPATEATGTGSADVVPPVGGTAGEAPSADAGGAGRSGSDDAAPVLATTGQATLGPTASMAATAVAAVADVDGASGAAATPRVGAQVARQVAVLGGGPDGDHSMTLVLTPETLGEVEVQVTLTRGSIELALRGAHEHGRAALLEALPELRRELEAAGLNPSRVEVARDTGGSLLDRQGEQGLGERGQPDRGQADRGQADRGQAHRGETDRGGTDRGEARSRPWGRPADISGSGASPAPNRATSSGVDLLV